MVGDWNVPVVAVLAALAVLAGALVLLDVSRRRARDRADRARALAAEVAALHERVDVLERRLAAPAPGSAAEPATFTITSIDEPTADVPDSSPAPVAPAVPGPLFADLVLREGVVQAASLAAGVRRALQPETRHRIRYAMRREVKRARKQRRADVRQARREVAARAGRAAREVPGESAA